MTTGRKAGVGAAAILVAGWVIAEPAAQANEYSCGHAAAANGYVNSTKYLWQVEQDCAVAYKIAYPGGLTTHEQAVAAVAAAEQYLRSLGYDAATVERMDIAGHGT